RPPIVRERGRPRARRVGDRRGARRPMSMLERDIHIDAPPERVYDIVSDPSCLHRWVTIQDALEEAPDGELEQGSRLVQRLRVAGQCFTVTWTVMAADRPSKLV